jgi:hypothetical protein
MRTRDSLLTAMLPLCVIASLTAPTFANPIPQEVWYDDMEGDVSGYTTADFTATVTPNFHVDSYMAYEGDHSWWCGTFDYDSDGGYGNGWDDRLDLPPVEIYPVPVADLSWGQVKSMFLEGDASGRVHEEVAVEPAADARPGERREMLPVLTYAFRHDSEPTYDFTYVQAESSGVYVNLNGGYDGVQEWTELGASGFVLSDYDHPFRVRFRFISDGAASDEDGRYYSTGGAFHVDNIKVYDYNTGGVFFFDDVESGGLCAPSVPEAAGDYWHLIDRKCPAYSDPHSWWCGVDADTGLVPPNLRNGLYTPLVEFTLAYSCTAHFAGHFAIPTIDNDFIAFEGTVNGTDYYAIASWWGDFGTCDGWAGSTFSEGLSLDQFGAPVTHAGMLFTMHTTENGCGPGGGGDAGFMLDDLWICTNGYSGYPPFGAAGRADGDPLARPKLLEPLRYRSGR